MEFFRIKHDIPFMSYGRFTTAISLVTFLFAIFFLATRGLNFGVDFTGGTVIEIHYAQPADLNKVRDQLGGMGLHDAQVQNFGSSKDVLIQVPLKQNTSGAKLSEQVFDALRSQDAGVEMRFVRRFPDDQDCAAQLLHEEESRLDGGRERLGARAVGPVAGFESAVRALAGEGRVDPPPGVVSVGEIVGHDSDDDSAGAAALRAGFEPASGAVVGADETLGVRDVAHQGPQPLRRDRTEDLVFRARARRCGGGSGTGKEQEHCERSEFHRE